MEHASQEVLGGWVLWVVDHLLRRSLLDDASLFQEDDPVGCGAREPDLVGGHQNGRARRLQVQHQIQDLAHQHRVEGRGDLVEQEEFGIGGQGPDDRDALLLPAGEPVGKRSGLVAQADALQQLLAPGLRGVAGDAVHLPRCQVMLSSTLRCGNRL